jgi:hypothetical protein
MPASLPPPDTDPRIRRVASFSELVTTPLADGVNALCWARELPPGFGAVVEQLGTGEGLVVLDEEALRTLPVDATANAAIELLVADLLRLRERDLDPVLNLIHGYPHDDSAGPVATDVFSFHADSAPVPADTWLCTYHGPPTEGLRNDQAVRRVDQRATRDALLRAYGGADDAGFRDYLRENCYDLHYAPLPGARPWSFGIGHLWRIATEYPGSPVPPCIHRAPTPPQGSPPRLLLIS